MTEHRGPRPDGVDVSRLAAALPADAVLLHIGPHKTGTTALQKAFHHARPALAANGTHYAGKLSQAWLAALAATGRAGRPGDRRPSRREWTRLVNEVAEHRNERVMVSSERFSGASPQSARRIVDDLGRDRVHVLVTLRPLHKILPSQWQQTVRIGMVRPYRVFLKHTLSAPSEKWDEMSFWRRHAHERLVQRWADAAGADRVTVLVLDEDDRMMYMHAVEDLLDVPRGTAVPQPSSDNRSLTAGEIELVRRVNMEFRRRGWTPRLYAEFVRNAVISEMQTRTPGKREPAITTPRWALEQAAAIGARAAAAIEASGVSVVGDLSTLGSIPADEPRYRRAVVPTEAAARAVVAAIARAHEQERAGVRFIVNRMARRVYDRVRPGRDWGAPLP